MVKCTRCGKTRFVKSKTGKSYHISCGSDLKTKHYHWTK